MEKKGREDLCDFDMSAMAYSLGLTHYEKYKNIFIERDENILELEWDYVHGYFDGKTGILESDKNDIFARPTLKEMQDWVKKFKNVFIVPILDTGFRWKYRIYANEVNNFSHADSDENYPNSNEALKTGLKRVLKNLM